MLSFVVDPKKERICVQEAHTLGIPLIGIADTNCDPEELDYVIPGNDDAIRAVKLIVSKMADAVIEANQGVAGEDEEYVEKLKKQQKNNENLKNILKWRIKSWQLQQDGKRIKRDDRCRNDGLQKSSERI